MRGQALGQRRHAALPNPVGRCALRGRRAMAQHGADDALFAIPAHEVNLPHTDGQRTEDIGRDVRGDLVGDVGHGRLLSQIHKQEQKQSVEALSALSFEGRKYRKASSL